MQNGGSFAKVGIDLLLTGGQRSNVVGGDRASSPCVTAGIVSATVEVLREPASGLCHLDCVSQPGTKEIALAWTDHLRLALEASEGPRIDQAVVVASKRTARINVPSGRSFNRGDIRLAVAFQILAHATPTSPADQAAVRSSARSPAGVSTN